MKQKLALAGVLAADTPLVILDEPTSNLDPTVRGEVASLVREARAAGRTVIFSSHILSEVELSCDRVVLLRSGRIAHEQVLADLKRQHRIRAVLTGPLVEPAPELAAQLTIVRGPGHQVTIEAHDDLSPVARLVGQAAPGGSADRTARLAKRLRSPLSGGAAVNRALLKKAFGEIRILLPCFVLLMFGFQILFVWMTSEVDLRHIEMFLRHMPDYWKRLLPVSIDAMTTYAGRVAIGFDHPIISLGAAYWAIARGSDAVSGPLNRGTMEIMLAQPVRRVAVLGANMAVTIFGAATLAVACWLGNFVGLAIVPKMHGVPATPYAFCALNLFAYTCCLAGATTLISACDRYRSRTIGVALGFFVVSVLLKVVGRVSDRYQGFLYVSFLSAFEPQRFVDPLFDPVRLSVEYDVPSDRGRRRLLRARGDHF